MQIIFRILVAKSQKIVDPSWILFKPESDRTFPGSRRSLRISTPRINPRSARSPQSSNPDGAGIGGQLYTIFIKIREIFTGSIHRTEELRSTLKEEAVTALERTPPEGSRKALYPKLKVDLAQVHLAFRGFRLTSDQFAEVVGYQNWRDRISPISRFNCDVPPALAFAKISRLERVPGFPGIQRNSRILGTAWSLFYGLIGRAPAGCYRVLRRFPGSKNCIGCDTTAIEIAPWVWPVRYRRPGSGRSNQPWPCSRSATRIRVRHQLP